MGADLFAFKINYNDPDTNFVGDALFNGNISQTLWKSVTDNTTKRYGYDYDALNRLKDAKYYAGTHASSTDRYNENLTYDKNGNIMSLNRRGSHNAFNQVIDLLTYQYNGNQLQNVAEDPMGNAAAGFIDGNTGGTPINPDYLYDAFGNMTVDKNKKITNIRYNHLNLPTEIVFNANQQTKINYTYNAAGVKVQKIANVGATSSGGTKSSTTQYLGGYQYNNNILQFFPQAQGYVKHNINPNTNNSEFDYVYQYKDHLGNIRINYTFDVSTNNLKVLEENHYYPFGLKHTEAIFRKDILFEKEEQSEVWEKKVSASVDPIFIQNETVPNSGYQYKYNGKEWQDELNLNMYNMDMRMYDPAIARWVVKDPVVHYDFSPYSAFDNNPVFWADPSGADAVYNWDDGKYYNNGKEVSFEDALASYGIGSDNGDKDKDKKKKEKSENKNNLRSSASDPLDGYDGFTHQGDDSSPPISEVSDEEMSRRNQLFVNVVTLPLQITGTNYLLAKIGSQFNALNIKLATWYLTKTGQINNFKDVGGFSFNFSKQIYIYHNSLEAAVATRWSTTTLYSSRATAFNELALGYKGTTNFAQQIYTANFSGLSIVGSASRQGLTPGGGLQQLAVKTFSRKTNTSIFNAGF